MDLDQSSLKSKKILNKAPGDPAKPLPEPKLHDYQWVLWHSPDSFHRKYLQLSLKITHFRLQPNRPWTNVLINYAYLISLLIFSPIWWCACSVVSGGCGCIGWSFCGTTHYHCFISNKAGKRDTSDLYPKRYSSIMMAAYFVFIYVCIYRPTDNSKISRRLIRLVSLVIWHNLHIYYFDRSCCFIYALMFYLKSD